MRSRGSASLALRVLLAVGFVVAAGATVLVILAKDVQMLRLAAVLALWAALIAAFAVTRSRRDAKAATMREKEAHLAYQVELHREVSARHEYEAELAAQMAQAQSQQIAELREQLDRLTEVLTALADGEVFVSRMTLSAESARFRSGQSLVSAAMPAAVTGESSRAIGWVEAAQHATAAAPGAATAAAPAVVVPSVLVEAEGSGEPEPVERESARGAAGLVPETSRPEAPESDEESEPAAESEPDAEPEPEPEPKVKPETGAEPGAEPETGAEPGAEPGAGAEPEPVAVDDPEEAPASVFAAFLSARPAQQSEQDRHEHTQAAQAGPDPARSDPARSDQAPPAAAAAASEAEPRGSATGTEPPATDAPVTETSAPDAAPDDSPAPATTRRRSRHAEDDDDANGEKPWWRRAVDEAVRARNAEAATSGAAADRTETVSPEAADTVTVSSETAAVDTPPRPLPTPEPAPQPFRPEPFPEPLPGPLPVPHPAPAPQPVPEPLPVPPPVQVPSPQTASAHDRAAGPSYTSVPTPQSSPASGQAAAASHDPAAPAIAPDLSPEELLAAYGLTAAPRRRRRD